MISLFELSSGLFYMIAHLRADKSMFNILVVEKSVSRYSCESGTAMTPLNFHTNCIAYSDIIYWIFYILKLNDFFTVATIT